MEFKKMTWEELKEEAKKDTVVILPVGAVEQHGYHLPVDTDADLANYVAEKVATRTNTLLLPPVYYGYTEFGLRFPGCVSIKSEHFIHYIEDIVISLDKTGFKRVIIINGHGGNDSSIKNSIIELCYKLDDLKIKSENWWRMKNIAEMSEKLLGHPIRHACATEASLMLHINKALVKNELFDFEFNKNNFYVSNNLSKKYVTKTGILNADQRKASEELGKKIFDMAIGNYSTIIEKF